MYKERRISKSALLNQVKIGKEVTIWHFANLYNCEIGNNTSIGSFTEIGKDVKIGSDCKIEAFAFIPSGIKIRDKVFIGPGVIFTNDLRPRAFSTDWKVILTVVKEGASIGANSTILCGITIGKYAMIGAGSVVTKSVPDHALVYGNPAKLKGFVCKCGEEIKKVGENKNYIILKCTKCREKIKIPTEVYKELKR